MTEFSEQYLNDLNNSNQVYRWTRLLAPFAIPLILDTDLPEIHVTTDEFVSILNGSKLFALREFAIDNP